jgi:hypothetical protein
MDNPITSNRTFSELDFPSSLPLDSSKTPVYGVIIEIFGFWCPLMAFETWLEVAVFRLLAALSFCITSMRCCTLIFLRTCSLRALSSSAL